MWRGRGFQAGEGSSEDGMERVRVGRPAPGQEEATQRVGLRGRGQRGGGGGVESEQMPEERREHVRTARRPAQPPAFRVPRRTAAHPVHVRRQPLPHRFGPRPAAAEPADDRGPGSKLNCFLIPSF
jgi:hypothetical protein